MEEKLPEQFVRIHHSHIINMEYLRRIKASSPTLACMTDGEELAISRNGKDDLIHRLVLL